MATSNSGGTVNLKLLIDTKGKRVLFAEAGKDFVDFLFTFLSLPVGSIIRLLSKDGMVGSLGKLYESIENLNDTYMQPNFNKEILLKPKEPVVLNTLGLFTNVESNSNTRKTMYVCTNYRGSYNSHDPLYVTEDPRATCPSCHSTMSRATSYLDADGLATKAAETSSSSSRRGYVKEVVTYMIMDDLEVKPMSTISCIALLNRFKVDLSALEEKVVSLSLDEGVKLLKASLESKSVLTNAFLMKKEA